MCGYVTHVWDERSRHPAEACYCRFIFGHRILPDGSRVHVKYKATYAELLRSISEVVGVLGPIARAKGSYMELPLKPDAPGLRKTHPFEPPPLIPVPPWQAFLPVDREVLSERVPPAPDGLLMYPPKLDFPELQSDVENEKNATNKPVMLMNLRNQPVRHSIKYHPSICITY